VSARSSDEHARSSIPSPHTLPQGKRSRKTLAETPDMERFFLESEEKPIVPEGWQFRYHGPVTRLGIATTTCDSFPLQFRKSSELNRESNFGASLVLSAKAKAQI